MTASAQLSVADVLERAAEITRLYAVGAGNTARQIETEVYGLTSADISHLAEIAHPRQMIFREHWERGFRAARGDDAARASLRGSFAEEAGARDSRAWDIGFRAGRGEGGACSMRTFGKVEAAGFSAGKHTRRFA